MVAKCVFLLCLYTAMVGLCSCTAASPGGGVPGVGRPESNAQQHRLRRHVSQTPIQHVVVIIQENRTVDDLFQFLPGANTASQCAGPRSLHNLTARPLQDPTSPGHSHAAFVNDMYSGWDGIAGDPVGPATNAGWTPSHCAYVPQSQAQPYYSMAQAYTFANNFFQTNQGPSYPAHQYLISGSSACTGGSTSGRNGPVYGPCGLPTPWPVSDNSGGHQGGGCDSPAGTAVSLVSPTDTTVYAPQGVYPCFTRPSIVDEAQAAGLTWLFYQTSAGAGYWKSADSIESLWCLPGSPPCNSPGSRYRANVRYPSPQGSDVAAKFVSDLGSCGTLANLTYITPNDAESDHAGLTDGSGPSYVAALVNAIGQSCYWNSTAIFITWDDWGGWFDHVCPGGGTSNPCPPPRTTNELGYRVPLIVVSPYAKNDYVATNEYDFGSILLYVENNFGLPSLGTADAIANDLTNDIFNYGQRPTPFAPFNAPLHRGWFRKHQKHDPPGTLVPDDDTDNG